MGALFVFLGVFFLLAILVKYQLASAWVLERLRLSCMHIFRLSIWHKVRFLHLTVPLIWRFRSL